jgi:hypothetical protein
MIPNLQTLKKEIDRARQEGLDVTIRIDADGLEHWRVIDRDKRALGMEKGSRYAAWESYLFGKRGE